MDEIREIAIRIKELREICGYTVEETAKELGIELPAEKAKENAEESGEFSNFLIENEDGELEEPEPDENMIDDDISLDLDFDVNDDLDNVGDFILDDEF